MGWFRPVHCKSVSAQELRALLSADGAVQKAALDIEQSLRGVLRNFGLKLGRISPSRYEARVRELLADNAMLEAAAAAILKARAALRAELSVIEHLFKMGAREPISPTSCWRPRADHGRKHDTPVRTWVSGTDHRVDGDHDPTPKGSGARAAPMWWSASTCLMFHEPQGSRMALAGLFH